MMDGDFTEHKPGWYEVKTCEADDFRNQDKSEADLAKWGTAYAVVFKGDAGTYYWSKREKPGVDQKYYGHIEPSKSGKSMNFKLEKEQPTNNVPSNASSNFENPERQASIQRSVALQQAVAYVSESNQLTTEEIINVADKFYAWLTHSEVKDNPITDPFPKNEEDTDKDDPAW